MSIAHTRAADSQQAIDQLMKEAMAKLGENIPVKRFVRFKVGEE